MLSRCYRHTKTPWAILRPFSTAAQQIEVSESILVSQVPASKMNLAKQIMKINQIVSGIGFVGNIGCIGYWQAMEPLSFENSATLAFNFMLLTMFPWLPITGSTRLLGRIELCEKHGVLTVSHIDFDRERIDKSFDIRKCYFPKDKIICRLPDGKYLYNRRLANREALELLESVASEKPKNAKGGFLDDNALRWFRVSAFTVFLFVACFLRTVYEQAKVKSEEIKNVKS